MPRKSSPRRPAAEFEVTSAIASRALYVDPTHGALHKVQVSFDTRYDGVINFDLDVHEAAKLVEQLMSAYNAIMPALKTSRGGFGL